MRSHLNLEHKTFLGGKLPSCVSARSAAQGIQSDRCQYHSCSTDSNNENSTQLSLGFDSVTLSLLNLCPQQYGEFYRDNVFKCVHQELWGICCLYWGASELWELWAPRGVSQLHPGSTLGCMEDACPFLSSSLLLPTLSFFPCALGREEVGVWGALGFFWASTAVLV